MVDKFGRSKRYNRIYGDGIRTPSGRFSWPSLVSPKAPPPPKPGEAEGKPRYEVTLLIDKKNPDLAEFLKTMKTMSSEMVEQYNRYAGKLNLAKLHPDISVCKDGDEADVEKYPYYKGMLLLECRNPEMPVLFNAAKEAMEASEVLAGMEGRCVVVPHLGPTGLSYRLEVLQLLNDDGTRFGGGKRDYDNLVDAVSGGTSYSSDVESSDGEEEEPSSEENGADGESEETTPPVPAQTAPQQMVDPKAMRARIAAEVKEKAKTNKVIGAGGAAAKGGKGKSAAINLL